jgi:hypothetical protein
MGELCSRCRREPAEPRSDDKSSAQIAKGAQPEELTRPRQRLLRKLSPATAGNLSRRHGRHTAQKLADCVLGIMDDAIGKFLGCDFPKSGSGSQSRSEFNSVSLILAVT